MYGFGHSLWSAISCQREWLIDGWSILVDVLSFRSKISSHSPRRFGLAHVNDEISPGIFPFRGRKKSPSREWKSYLGLATRSNHAVCVQVSLRCLTSSLGISRPLPPLCPFTLYFNNLFLSLSLSLLREAPIVICRLLFVAWSVDFWKKRTSANFDKSRGENERTWQFRRKRGFSPRSAGDKWVALAQRLTSDFRNTRYITDVQTDTKAKGSANCWECVFSRSQSPLAVDKMARQS